MISLILRQSFSIIVYPILDDVKELIEKQIFRGYKFEQS